jgi:hypothetical protein
MCQSRLGCLGFIGVFALASSPWGIDPPLSALSLRGRESQEATNGRVLLASVVDARNRPLVTVGADDFLITEGTQSRDVLDVHVADYPVIVLIDDGEENRAQPALAVIKTAVARFISRIGQRPVAVGTLSRADRFIATFEDDRAAVLSRVEALGSSSEPAAPLLAIAHASRVVSEAGAPFSAVVIVTSRTLSSTDSTAAERLPEVLESGATVHVVAARLTAADDGTNGPDLLRGLAEQTHGQYTGIFSLASYGIALDRLADRMAAEMMIEYLVPPGPAVGDVRVGARIPGARVVGLGVSK